MIFQCRWSFHEISRIWACAGSGPYLVWAIRWFRNANMEQGSLSEPAITNQSRPEPARASHSQRELARGNVQACSKELARVSRIWPGLGLRRIWTGSGPDLGRIWA